MQKASAILESNAPPAWYLNPIFILCILQLFFWTLLPYLTRGSLPHDVLEGIAWGFEWELGYYKHPPLVAWILSAWIKGAELIGINLDLAAYALAQVVVVAAIYPLYRLSLDLLPYRAAVVATTVLLAGILYFNIYTMNLTPDTIQTPIWAWSIWVFYLAITRNTWRYWLALGGISALALWAKYSGVLLIFSEFLVLILIREYRWHLKNIKFYAAFFLSLILYFPHVAWLIHNDFLPMFYAKISVIQKTPQLIDHLTEPVGFLVSQLAVLIVPLIMVWPFYMISRIKDAGSRMGPAFIYIVGITPLALTVLLSVISGQKIVVRWGTPFFCCAGLLLVFTLGKMQIENITDKQWRNYLITAFTVFFLMLAACNGYHYLAPYLGKLHSDAYFPTKLVTQQFEEFWDNKTAKPFTYIIGDNYWAAFLSVYSKSHPQVLIEADSKISPWIDMQDLQQRGGMIIWRTKNPDETALPPSYRYLPRAEFIGVIPYTKNLPSQTLAQTVKPIWIGMGWIPPAE